MNPDLSIDPEDRSVRSLTQRSVLIFLSFPLCSLQQAEARSRAPPQVTMDLGPSVHLTSFIPNAMAISPSYWGQVMKLCSKTEEGRWRLGKELQHDAEHWEPCCSAHCKKKKKSRMFPQLCICPSPLGACLNLPTILVFPEEN